MFKYRIQIWEPAIDPGGYQDSFIIEADNDEEAKTLAQKKGRKMWPDHTGLLTKILSKEAI